MVRARGWPRSGDVVTTPMLLRKSVVATAVRGAASEGRSDIGSTTASARHERTTARSSLHRAVTWRDVMERLSSLLHDGSDRPFRGDGPAASDALPLPWRGRVGSA